VAVARGNEKGRVERAIRYVRTAFFAARPFRDLDDLNRQALQWCQGLAADRPCPEDQRITVGQAFASERPKLMALPANPFPTEEREEVRARKTPYVRFDGNDYSVPHRKVGRQLVILASPEQVRVLDGNEVIATHRRSYDKAEQIELPAHVEELVKAKRHARAHRGLDLLSRQVDNAAELLETVACRGGNLGNVTARLLRYVDQYGAPAVQRAIGEALERGTPHPQAVRYLLERERQALGRPVPLAIPLSEDRRVLDLSVRPHSLHHYDQLEETPTDEHDQPQTPDRK
jgi:phosphoglycolate phosphatase-like HAD superfamily hydrolase